MNTTACIALGSNIGDRRANLDFAVGELRTHPAIEVWAVSSYHETEPVGGPPGQHPYLNAAAKIGTSLEPYDLLQVLLAIETRRGRVRSELNAPRTLDLDLLLYGDWVNTNSDPVVPHPRMHHRSFVLEPLAEIAGELRHPVFDVSIRRLAENLRRLPPAERPLAGLRTLITGSTSGIGRAIAVAFARAGAWVQIHGRNPETCRRVCDELKNNDVATNAIAGDLTNDDDVRRIADTAWSKWEYLDVLVCNAGADTLTGSAAQWSFERKLQELWAVDVRATIALSRDLGGRMKQRGSGLILTMGWDQAETGMEGDSGQLFAVVKNAIMGFSRSLALTLSPEVRVNCLAPGWIRTAWGETASDIWQQRVVRETPLQRWGSPEDVAGAAKWLASPEGRFITGQVIRINGGAVR